jgi:hypothetical protein
MAETAVGAGMMVATVRYALARFVEDADLRLLLADPSDLTIFPGFETIAKEGTRVTMLVRPPPTIYAFH